VASEHLRNETTTGEKNRFGPDCAGCGGVGSQGAVLCKVGYTDYLLLCGSVHYEPKGKVLAGGQLDGGGEDPLVLIIFGKFWLFAGGLNKAQGAWMPCAGGLAAEFDELVKFERGTGIGI